MISFSEYYKIMKRLNSEIRTDIPQWSILAWLFLLACVDDLWMILHFFFWSVYREKQPPEVFFKKGVLGNFAKFTWKHMCWSFFLNSAVGLRPATLLKRGLLHRCFIVNFAKFLRTLFLQNISGRLLLYGEMNLFIKRLF